MVSGRGGAADVVVQAGPVRSDPAGQLAAAAVDPRSVEEVRRSPAGAATFTDPRPCAANVDRLTFNATLIETGTESYRLAKTKARGRAATQDVTGRATYPQTRRTAAADG